jgi:hypothetical protein
MLLYQNEFDIVNCGGHISGVMTAYTKRLTIGPDKRLVLTDLPFETGQQVEVLLLPETRDRSGNAAELDRLLKETQNLPQAQTISESQIAEEIATYRAGR